MYKIYSSIILLLTILIIFSCQKEEPIIEAPVVEPPIVEKVIDSIGFKNHTVEGIMFIEEMVSIMFKGALQNPQLFNMNNDVAIPRTGCPCQPGFPASVTYPHTITMVFNCTPASSNGVLIKGSLDVRFTGPIMSNAASDIFIKPSADFQIGDYKIALTGASDEIYLDYRTPATGDFYKIIVGDNGASQAVVTDMCSGCPTENYTTTYSTDRTNNTFGDLFLIDAGNTHDMNDLTTYFDDEFSLRFFKLNAHCENTDGDEFDMCLDTSENLVFSPLACGCVTEGKLRIRDGSDCSTNGPNSNLSVTDEYDFGDGTCNDTVNKEDNTGITTINMKSC